MSDDIDHGRRRLLGSAAVSIAAARLGMLGPAHAPLRGPARAAAAPFDSLKQVDAGVLNVGYAEAGPADGPAVLLLHGWPYDIHSYVDVAPLLAAAGTA